MTINRTLFLLVAILLSAPVRSAELGTVGLATSCNAEANAHVQRGLALLHHMMYESAQKSFAAAAGVQPTCAIAYWGQAMTFVHPIWSDPPSASTFDKGRLAGRYRDGRRQEDGSRTRVRRVGAGLLQGRQVQQGGAESARLRPSLGCRPCEVSGRSGCRAVLRACAAGDCRSVGQDIRAAAARRRS